MSGLPIRRVKKIQRKFILTQILILGWCLFTTRYLSTTKSSLSEMLAIYSFCHDNVNNVFILGNRVPSLMEQQWLLGDLKGNLEHSDEYTVQLHRDVEAAPTFSVGILEHATRQLIPQFALLGTIVQQVLPTDSQCPPISANEPLGEDRRFFINCNVPWSAFICGVQGSGKSHTLSCLIG